MEFAIDPAKFHDAFAADRPAEQTAVMAATQRPVAELAFSEPNGQPAWKKLPSWAVVASGDKAAGADVVRSMAERAGATITEAEGSHVIIVSQPQLVADAILTAIAAAPRRRNNAVLGKEIVAVLVYVGAFATVEGERIGELTTRLPRRSWRSSERENPR